MNNVFAAVEREIGTRFDFKGTPAAIEWLEDKKGYVIIGNNQWQCDVILDIIRKRLAARELSAKVLDTSRTPHENNLKTRWEIPFKQGLAQDIAKDITKQLREAVPKVKAQIQGEGVRVTGSSKDELQKAISFLKTADFSVPLQFINYR